MIDYQTAAEASVWVASLCANPKEGVGAEELLLAHFPK